MNSLIIIACLILVVVWLTYKWGITRNKLNQANETIKRLKKYEKINSSSDVANPFEQLRED